MIIDLNLLKRLGKRFGVFPISAGPTPLQAALQKPEIVFIKAPAGIEPAFAGGGYQWDDELNCYRLGNQKLFLAPDGTTIWTFKDVLFRGLSLDSVQKWTSGDAEYPMGKANAFFIVYGKLTGQDLGEGETAGDNVPDGETEPGDGGGLATADDENAPPFSKDDIQKMLKGEFPTDTPTGPKASMDTAVPGEEPSAPMSGPPPSRLSKGSPPVEAGSEAEKIISTLYKQAHINPKLKLSKQNPIRLDSDAIIDLYQRAKTMPPEEGEKLIAFLKSGAIKPLMEGMIAKSQLDGLLEHIVGGIVDKIEKAKKKAKAKKKDSLSGFEKKEAGKLKKQAASDKKKTAGMNRFQGGYGSEEPPAPAWKQPEHSQMDWDSRGEQGHIPGRGAEQQWLEDLANKLWKDAEDIGHSHQGWKVKTVVPHGPDTTAYLLTLTKQYHKSRIFINRGGRWFWKDPIDRHQGWQEVEGPQMEPSIEQEQSGAGAAGGGAPGGMTTTSAVSPVTGPKAFGTKKKWTEKFQGRKEKELDEMTTTSGGGGSSAGTPGYSIPGAFGDKLSHKKDHIEVLGYKLTPDGEKEYNRSADKLYEVIKSQVTKMIAEGRRTCPHCNMMAINGVWTHEQGCPATKKRIRESDEWPGPCPKCGNPLRQETMDWHGHPYPWGAVCDKCGFSDYYDPPEDPPEEPFGHYAEGSGVQQEASGLGADFDRAQRAYDAQMPPEDPPEIECPECGGPGYFTQQWKKGRYYQWNAKCDKCGNTWGDDNLDDDRGER